MTDEWQPIETAPKDGTWIKVKPSQWANVESEVAVWSETHMCWSEPLGHSPATLRPTHWQPLRDEPAGEPAGGDA